MILKGEKGQVESRIFVEPELKRYVQLDGAIIVSGATEGH